MVNNLKKKAIVFLAVVVVIFSVAWAIFTDWEHFKTGLFG